MQLALQFLDPAAVFPGLSGAGRTRLAETSNGNGILYPAIELGRIQPVLAAPSTASGFIHRRRGNHRFQSGRRRPALTAATTPIARAIGQGIRPLVLQRRHAHAILA